MESYKAFHFLFRGRVTGQRSEKPVSFPHFWTIQKLESLISIFAAPDS
jgi:hypothetical protein